MCTCGMGLTCTYILFRYCFYLDDNIFISIGVAGGVIALLIIIFVVAVCCCGKSAREVCKCYCFCYKGVKILYELVTGDEFPDCCGCESGEVGEIELSDIAVTAAKEVGGQMIKQGKRKRQTKQRGKKRAGGQSRNGKKGGEEEEDEAIENEGREDKGEEDQEEEDVSEEEEGGEDEE